MDLSQRALQTNEMLFSLCLPPSVTGEVYCFPRYQLIFSFDMGVIYHLKGLKGPMHDTDFQPQPRSDWPCMGSTNPDQSTICRSGLESIRIF